MRASARHLSADIMRTVRFLYDYSAAGIQERHCRIIAGCVLAKGKLLGVSIGTRSLPDLIVAAQRAIAARGAPFVFACANPHSLVMANGDAEFRAALSRASAVVADGVGCLWGAALCDVSVGPRITGSDFFVALMSHLDRTGGKAFFFGSNATVLEQLTTRLREDFPCVKIAALSPPYRAWSPEENSQMLVEIRRFAPDVLWVGMTAPKQEKWVAANDEASAVPVIGSIGAVFDYYAGATHRAPDWVCKAGFEWLYRLPREPKRLWRRTLVSAPTFLWLAMLQRLRILKAV
jgi:N-acetylglucosaminyldiphosphoundecaprenol N-acetyl-beta-D-mannosaminyltransferase